ncbi:MAG: hypothetical protein J6128_00080 [Clostridia bacterium]|nr:hypothetical protein [Clostridia bacterium]
MRPDRGEKISEILDGISDKYTDEAAEFAAEKSGGTVTAKRESGSGHIARWGVLAACLLLFAVIGSTAAAFAAESKEYNDAVAFFEKNGLSVEGLSRSDVKAVYRDIISEHYTYGKTAEVLRGAVKGTEFIQDDPGQDPVEPVMPDSYWRVSESGEFSYSWDYRYKKNETLGFEILECTALECSKNGSVLWTVEFEGMYLYGCSHTSSGTAVWGSNYRWDTRQTYYQMLACVSDEGEVLWRADLDKGIRYANTAAVMENSDGTWTMIGNGDGSYLYVSVFSPDGEEISFIKTDIGKNGIRNVTRLGDGYLLQMASLTGRNDVLLIRIDRFGNPVDSFSYAGDDCLYYVTDMVEFGGKVYLSAYSVPMQEDEGGRHELAAILDFLFENPAYTEEELVQALRDNYTAVLILVDPEAGSPEAFYSVSGSLGGELTVTGDGLLEWDVDSFVSAFFSPATSSFSVGGTCRVFCYSFGPDGAFEGQRDTGELFAYRR